MPQRQTRGRKTSPLKEWIGLVFALVALIGYIIGLAFLTFNLKLDETSWARAVFLLQGIETLALAAATWLFGREVSKHETKGKDLAVAAQVAGEATTEVDGTRVQTAVGEDEALVRLKLLREFASRLYPETLEEDG